MKESIVDKTYELTDLDIDELMDDWLERDGETFVKASDKHRLGWEKTLGEDDSYSSFFLGKPKKKEVLTRAYEYAKDMMAVVDPPMRVNIKISKGKDSFTDGKTVVVSTRMFDDKELMLGEQVDTFLGVTIHEGCHLKYTVFEELKRIYEFRTYTDGEMNIIKQLANIIEDERIEQLLGEDKPGLTRFLEKSKYYYFDQYYLDFVVPTEKDQTDFERLMNTFLAIIRYPKYLKEEDIIFFGNHLLTVKDLVLPYPTDTKGVISTSMGVYEVFKDFYKERLRDEEKRKSAEEGAEGSEGSEDSEATPEMSDKEITRKAEEKMVEDSKRILPALGKIVDDATKTKTLSDDDVTSEIKSREGSVFVEALEGTLIVGSEKDSFFTKQRDNRVRYMDSLGRVKKYVPAISKILIGNFREYKYIHRGMRHGLLDTNKLAEAYQGVPNVYIREGEVKTDKVAVVVLIDESGSMSGNRIVAARDTAVLINEAVGNIPNVELFMYGHTGDIRYSGATELNVYREKDYRPKYSLGSVEAHSQNRDGTAIKEVADRVRKQTNLPALYFILSDGAPAANDYGGYSAIQHTKQNVNLVERKGFTVVQVCISLTYDPKTMFKNFVVLEDMNKLAFDLGKVIKKATLQSSQNHII